ncbi:MAG: hypothetical protein ACKV19_25270 [Verrucomicrobiales bacterium]
MSSATASVPPPPLFRRAGCWITCLSILPVLVGGAILAENILGARKLARVKAELAAIGIELDPHKIPSSRPPDAENFFTTPARAALEKGALPAPTDKAVKRIAKWQPWADHSRFPIQSVHSAMPTDWTGVRDLIANRDKAAGLTSTDDPVADLSQALERDLAPLLGELTVARTRPHSHWVPDFMERVRGGEIAISVGIQWTDSIRELRTVLGLRTRFGVITRQPEQVSDSVLILLRLAEGTEAFGGIPASLTAVSLRRTALEGAWAAAEQRRAPGSTWHEWARAFASHRPLERLPQSIIEDMVLFESTSVSVRQPDGLMDLIYDRSNPPEPWRRAALRLVPHGWADINTANALEAAGGLWSLLQDPSRPDRFTSSAWRTEVGRWVHQKDILRHRWLVDLFVPIFPGTVSRVFQSHALCRLAEAACALEAYFRDHQSYPGSLEALVPAYLPAVPIDLDGLWIRYDLDPANGRYKLWSIGEDGVDDGGVEKTDFPRPDKSPRPWMEPVGDWVWHYPN